MTTTDTPNLTGFVEHNGIRMTAIGDDGDRLLALGHHNPIKMAHTFDWFLRHVIGEPAGLTEIGTPVEVAHDIHALWAVTINECGECGGRDDCHDCAAIRNSDWWVDWAVSEDDPGAFPVMVFHLDG
jgi:hypothetical protein